MRKALRFLTSQTPFGMTPEEALDLIEMEYEVLPAVLDVKDVVGE
jgi:hypothetical protein